MRFRCGDNRKCMPNVIIGQSTFNTQPTEHTHELLLKTLVSSNARAFVQMLCKRAYVHTQEATHLRSYVGTVKGVFTDAICKEMSEYYSLCHSFRKLLR